MASLDPIRVNPEIIVIYELARATNWKEVSKIEVANWIWTHSPATDWLGSAKVVEYTVLGAALVAMPLLEIGYSSDVMPIDDPVVINAAEFDGSDMDEVNVPPIDPDNVEPDTVVPEKTFPATEVRIHLEMFHVLGAWVTTMR